MNKHTPGPWYLRGKYSIHGPPDGPENWRSTNIVTVRANQKYREPVIDQANAHLIAAAPEMYEALEEMLDTASPWSYERIVAVLAKARGE